MKSIHRILLDALGLDTPSLYPNASHEPLWGNLELGLRRSRIYRLGVFQKSLRLGLFVLKASNVFRAKKWSSIDKNRHLIFALTVNQQLALKPVFQSLEASGKPSAIVQFDQLTWALRLSTLASLPFLPLLIFKMIHESGYRRRSYSWAIDEYLRGYGLYVLLRFWLKATQPKSVVVSNDHVLLPCTLVKAAQDEGIATFYLQHACVTKSFPPLRVDHAMLDGKDAAEKYDVVNPDRSNIYLVGIPKFDAFAKKTNTNRKARKIGVCFSLADETDRCVDLMRAISKFDVVVRPHMGMESSAINAIETCARQCKMEVSVHATEASFEFLQRIDVLISGTSAIALEAVLLNVTSLNYVLCTESPDWYGFIENHLTRSTDDLVELVEWVETLQINRPDVRHLAQRYCASVGTPFSGESAKIAAEIISSPDRAKSKLTKLEANKWSVSPT